jgi:D-beta-D-heptose 7-phosphate kinase/D-beta-D-heptose 1-phosphate adenosyltransferase
MNKKSGMLKEIDRHFRGKELIEYLDRFSKATVLVVGDIMLDEYIWGDVSRISPEAPVPVVEVQSETKMLGGAANVVNNIASLGGKAILCGVIGQDAAGQEILDRVAGLGYLTQGILKDPSRPTTIKTRVVAHSQQLVRFDREKHDPLQSGFIKQSLEFMHSVRNDLDAIIVADYGKGVISGPFMKGLREMVKGTGITVAVDPNVENYKYYQNVTILTPNHHEAGAYSRIKIRDEETLFKAGKKLLNDLDCKSVLITQGKDGMTLFEKNGEITHIPTIAVKVYDVSGAGDTVISTLSMGLATGMDLKAAAIVSNFAGGIVVGEVGTSTVKVKQLAKVIRARLP